MEFRGPKAPSNRRKRLSHLGPQGSAFLWGRRTQWVPRLPTASPPSLRTRLRRRRHLWLRRPRVTLEEFLAVLARLHSGQPGGIWLVAHHPFPENAVESSPDPDDLRAEVHSLRDPRPVLRVVRRLGTTIPARLGGSGSDVLYRIAEGAAVKLHGSASC